MPRHLRLDEPIQVEEKNGKPYRVQGRFVSLIIDRYRINPNRWEGHKPRNYWRLEAGEKTIEIYQTDAGRFFGGYKE